MNASSRPVPWQWRGCAFALAGCALGCSDKPADEPPTDPAWRLVLDELPGALISVSGTSRDDVWLVGSDAGDGQGALVLHFDGDAFERRAIGVDGDLWWVHALRPDRVFFGGTGGTIVLFDGDTFTEMDTPGMDTVFGIWAASDDVAFAVGGDPAREGRAFAWSLGEQGLWQPADVPDVQVSSYFKVWGTGRQEVRIVGAEGVILQSESGTFHQVDSPAQYSLTTVHASPGGLYAAVGGFGDGIVIEDSGQGWSDRTPIEAPQQLFGIWLSDVDGFAVGANGTILRREAEAWRPDPVPNFVTLDLHATWMDPQGGAWAVGGDLVSTSMTDGMLLYRGPHPPGAAVVTDER